MREKRPIPLYPALDTLRASEPTSAEAALADWERAHARLWRAPPLEEEPWQERRPSRLPVIAAAIAVMLGAMGLIGMRERVVRLAPGAAGLYSAAGLKVNVFGLDLRSVTSKIAEEGSRKVLTVEGEIVNLRQQANRVPKVALAVRGADGRERYVWTETPPKARLAAGETLAFRARLASPPADGADVMVRFAALDGK
ncbi:MULTISPECIES: hypothetical protein [Methylosinus]|uniref:DUF3426 domain-containing protein n=1 Tax=Methylosinus trichosporium (strain ATCC 35070 / NCIMB 11131 / UNIQEM 75 / OB3b) TaxID=595536 RepID=A0A2D2CVS0_METT3|nr:MULTISPECIES: hypothetical protein [Methylosinus]ATQ66795.1 hypothetical protein CQW49_01960 [Methylosinus trichosporium OB3b]OBS54186.1 hypothetical protein A8B73_01905 [Methylosinus sp. 3S-1]